MVLMPRFFSLYSLHFHPKLFSACNDQYSMRFILSLKDFPKDRQENLAQLLTHSGAEVSFNVEDATGHSAVIVNHDELVDVAAPHFTIEYLEDSLREQKLQDISKYRQETTKDIAENVNCMDVVYCRTRSWNSVLTYDDIERLDILWWSQKEAYGEVGSDYYSEHSGNESSDEGFLPQGPWSITHVKAMNRQPCDEDDEDAHPCTHATKGTCQVKSSPTDENPRIVPSLSTDEDSDMDVEDTNQVTINNTHGTASNAPSSSSDEDMDFEDTDNATKNEIHINTIEREKNKTPKGKQNIKMKTRLFSKEDIDGDDLNETDQVHKIHKETTHENDKNDKSKEEQNIKIHKKSSSNKDTDTDIEETDHVTEGKKYEKTKHVLSLSSDEDPDEEEKEQVKEKSPQEIKRKTKKILFTESKQPDLSMVSSTPKCRQSENVQPESSDDERSQPKEKVERNENRQSENEQPESSDDERSQPKENVERNEKTSLDNVQAGISPEKQWLSSQRKEKDKMDQNSCSDNVVPESSGNGATLANEKGKRKKPTSSDNTQAGSSPEKQWLSSQRKEKNEMDQNSCSDNVVPESSGNGASLANEKGKRRKPKGFYFDAADEDLFRKEADEDLFRKEATKKHSRLPYDDAERCQIVRYIRDHNEYMRIKGRELWLIMERRKICPNRTWQSMKEHFLKKIAFNLDAYDFLTSHEKSKFKQAVF